MNIIEISKEYNKERIDANTDIVNKIQSGKFGSHQMVHDPKTGTVTKVDTTAECLARARQAIIDHQAALDILN